MELPQFVIWAKEIIENFGYFGVFFINFIGCATIIFPLPAAPLVFIFGTVLNPLFVAIFAALGATLGELTGYGIGFGGKKILEKKYDSLFRKGKEWFEKGRGFLLIIFFAATPLPDDITGILGGLFKYNLRKFILASFLGKMIMNLVLAFGGFYGISWILNIFNISF